MSAIAELLPDLGGLARAPAPAIEVPPAAAVPESVRPALRRYAAERSPPARAALVVEVDRIGHGWEHELASRSLEARAELVATCRRASELHDELMTLTAAAGWLRSFPFGSVWEPEPYSLHVAGHQVAVPDLLGAIEDTVDVDERLVEIARRRLTPDPPYLPPALPTRTGSAARIALAEAGSTLGDVGDLMPEGASESAISRWLAGSRPYPEALPDVLEQLVGAGEAARILSLVPFAR